MTAYDEISIKPISESLLQSPRRNSRLPRHDGENSIANPRGL